MVLDEGASTKLPVSRMTPTVELGILLVILVDQIGGWSRLGNNTMLPSFDIVNSEDSGLEIGLARFATHTGVCFEILLYHIARYHLSGTVLSDREKRFSYPSSAKIQLSRKSSQAQNKLMHTKLKI